MEITQTLPILKAYGHKHSVDSAGVTLNKNNLQLKALEGFESILVVIKILAGMKTMEYGRATYEFVILRARTQVGNRSYIYNTK